MQHPNMVEFSVSGDYALFSDPITRVGGEKCTYQVPTYEALKGILSSVYWKPTIIWYIDKVRVMNQIQMEVKGMRPIKYNGGNDLAYGGKTEKKQNMVILYHILALEGRLWYTCIV